MIKLMLILLYLLQQFSYFSYPYTNTDTDIAYLTKRALVHQTTIPLNSNSPYYSFPFDYTFSAIPFVGLSIVSLKIDQSGPNGKFNILTWMAITQTQFQGNFNVLYLTTFLLELCYIAIDYSVVGKFQYPTVQIDISGGSYSSKKDYDVGVQVQLKDNTFFICFLRGWTGINYIGIFQLKIDCTKKTDHIMEVDVYFPGANDETVILNTNPNVFGRKVTVSSIIFENDGSKYVMSNKLTAYNSIKSPTLTLDISYPQDIFFIGLTSCALPTINIELRLHPSSIQILAPTPFHQIHYSFIYIKHIQNLTISYLQQINTNVFGQEAYLIFQMKNLSQVKLEQFSMNVTWFTTLSVIQYPHNLNQIILSCMLVQSPAIHDNINITINLTHGWKKYQKLTIFRLIVVQNSTINIIQKTMSFYVLNTIDSSPDYFTYTSSNFQLINSVQDNLNTTVNFVYDDILIVGHYQSFNYFHPTRQDKANIAFFVPQVTSIKTSTMKTFIKIKLKQFFTGLPYTNDKFFIQSNCVQNFTVTNPTGQIVFQQDYLRTKELLNSTFKISYRASVFVFSTYQMVFKLVTLKNVRVIVNTNTSQFLFVNVKNPQRYIKSSLSYNISGILTQSVSCLNNNQFLVTVVYNPTINDTSFLISAKQPSTSYAIEIDTKIVERYLFFKATQYCNNLTIIFQNTDNLNNSTVPQITFNISSIQIDYVVVSTDSQRVIIQINYNKTIADQQLDIFYENDVSTIFKDIVSVNLKYDFPLHYCVALFQQRTKMYHSYSTILQYIYLVLFLYSSICDNKLIAIQIIFLIQLVYYSMIPIGIYCPPFIGIQGMKYISGINPLFQNLKQVDISYDYLIFNYKSNFLTNVNLMILILITCPILYVILTFLGNKNKNYKTKPRLLKYGKAFLLQFLFTSLIFSSFNIYISFTLDLSYIGSLNILSFLVSIFVAALLPIFCVLVILYKEHFIEFKEKYNYIQRIGSISQKTTVKIRQLYPFVLSLEFILVPIFISIYQFISFSLYAVFGVTLCVTVYILVSTPYARKLDNIRLIIHRVLVIAICITNIVFKSIKDENAPESSFVYWIPLLLFIFLTFGVIIDGVWAIIQSIKWFKKKGVIDHKMKLQTVTTLQKPKPISSNLGVYYPKLQYGQFKRQNMLNPRKKRYVSKQNQNQQTLMQQNQQSGLDKQN